MSPLAQLTSEKNIGNSPLASERPADILSAAEVKEYSDKYPWIDFAAKTDQTLYIEGKNMGNSPHSATYTIDGQVYVSPTIIQKTDAQGNLLEKGLKLMDRDESFSFAARHGIPVQSVKEGDDLSRKISRTMGWLAKRRSEKN